MATSAPLYTFTARDSGTIRDGILRVIRNGLIERGVASPNVTPGSDWYVLAQSVGNQLSVVEANAVVKSDSLMPDTAEAADLARLCAIYGLKKQVAAGSIGSVVMDSTGTVSLTAGDKLLDGAGLQYQVVTTGSYADGVDVLIEAIDTGEKTNHVEGDVLRWVSGPAFANEKALVSAAGLIDGLDDEDDEGLRARLFALLQNPPVSGNTEHVAEMGEASSAAVQKTFVYPGIQGGATVHAACTKATTATNKSREIAGATMTGTIAPYIQGRLPEHVYSVITTVTDVNADVAFGLTLPDAPTASPPGPGGGWTNGTPWPAPDASTTWRCTVTAVSTTKVFTVDATSLPVRNVTKVCWLSPIDWRLYEAKVVDVSGTSGAYVITLDSPFAGITTGSYIWPHCQNAQVYVDAILASFALMGPGEKTANLSALVRGHRHPRPATGWPSTLGGHLTRALSANPNTEVQSAQFFYRTDGTTTTTGGGGVVTPQVPADVEDPPNIFVPRNLGFYRVP